MRGNKYKNIKVNGYDSKAEASYARDLALLKAAGEIKDFQEQVRYTLQDGFKKNGVTHRAIIYKADFVITNNDGSIEVVDVKGYKTEVFKIKRKLFEKRYPNLTIKIVEV